MARKIVVNRITREYVLHAPVGSGDRPPLPLVVMFHGGGGTAKITAVATGWSTKADAEGFLVAYPEGLRRDPNKPPGFLRNPQFWNLRSGLSHAEFDDVDDVAFVAAMLDEIESTNPVDRARVYLCGFSNGAAMTLRAGVDLSPRIAAVAAVAGHLWNADRPPARPVPLLFIAGERDPLAPPAGGRITSPWGRNLVAPPTIDTAATWARWLHCPAQPRTHEDAGSVRRLLFGPGDGGSEVRYLLHGAGHVWPGGPPVLAERYTGPATDKLDATKEIWEFFRQFAIR